MRNASKSPAEGYPGTATPPTARERHAAVTVELRRVLGHSLAVRGARKQGNNNMARKPGSSSVGEFALFDVIYEDGSQRSNRRVPLAVLGGLDGDDPAKSEIAKQDREIAEKSGRPALTIKTIKRAGAK
jgi:hypothetical protein